MRGKTNIISASMTDFLRFPFSFSFGISQLQSPSRQKPDNKSSYSVLQNTARTLLNEAITNSSSDGSILPQQFEDFVAEMDRFVDEEKKKKNDLQEQVRTIHITVVEFSFGMGVYSILFFACSKLLLALILTLVS